MAPQPLHFQHAGGTAAPDLTILFGPGAARRVVTYDQYLRDVAGQVLRAHESLKEMPDGPGALESLGREAARINALFGAIVSRVRAEPEPSRGHLELAGAAEKYLDSYSFAREIETLSALYAGDSARVRNMRLKMVESLDDGGLAGKIKYVLEEMGA